MAAAEESLFQEDFGQKVDLTVRIREILQAYADGISIVKELVQNADDARAREVRFCWDLRTHGTDTIVDAKMAPFQGPSLLVYNNAVFTEADFEVRIVCLSISVFNNSLSASVPINIVATSPHPEPPDHHQSIQNIGNSQKKGAVSKTGRFGIGFNSVYHVSDVPSFISGRHIVYFDPHARFLPKYV